MSRAFVKDGEEGESYQEFADRPISPHPNLVTARGLRLIDEEIAALRRALAAAQAAADRPAIARASRDLRYWAERRAKAQLTAAPQPAQRASFATRVTILRDDGRRQTFSIVGEDEADPAAGRIAWTAPLARALAGRAAGETVAVPGGEAEILAVAALEES